MIPHATAKAVARAVAQSPHDARWAEEIAAKVLADCFPKQRQFVEDTGRRVAARVGRGGGKSTGAMARMIIKMVRTPRARCVYIATTKEHARELIWDKLKDTLQRLGVEATFNETRLTVVLKRNGARLKLTGADDNKEIDKLRGMSFHEVAIDEAASHEQRLLERLIKRVVGPRLGEFSGCIVLFGTPGHDLRGIFHAATAPGSKEHRPYEKRGAEEWIKWSSHSWTIEDGVPFVRALALEHQEHLIDKAENGWSDDHPVWRREYLGEWAADDTEMMFRYRATLTGEAAAERNVPDGTAWNQWDPPRAGPMQLAELPAGPDGKARADWHYAYGFDMGHSDPFATTIFAFSPSDTTRTLYHVYSFEKTKMYGRPIAQLLLGADETRPTGCCPHEKPEGLLGATGWPIGMVSDMTHLGGNILDELAAVYGIHVEPAEQKGKFAAIELFNGDLIDGRIKILKCSTLEDQLASLQWQPDEFGRLREPKGAPNHSADSAIYARRLIAHLFDTGTMVAKTPRNDNAPPAPAAYDEQPEEDPLFREPDWGDLYR